MCLKKGIKISRSLAFRLTLWYAGIFILSAAAVFVSFYLVLTAKFKERIDVELKARVGLFASIQSSGGLEALKRFALLESQATGEKKMFFRLLYPTGIIFSNSTMAYWEDIGVTRSAVDQVFDGADVVFETLQHPRAGYRVRIIYAEIGAGVMLQLGQSMEPIARLSEAFKFLFVLTVVPLFMLAASMGWFMARRALSGVSNVTRTARQISAGALDRRVPVGNSNDEIDQLAATFNHMLDRIQRLVKGIEEISDNVAHDLRSPLTRIRGNAEIVLATDKRVEAYQALAADTIEECDRLLQMINTMLFISKTEAGIGGHVQEPLDLREVVSQACELFQPSAAQKQIQLRCGGLQRAIIMGDVTLIQRMIANLIDNALKYTPNGGWVTLSLQRADRTTTDLCVADSGVGIAEQNRERVFERFFRCDPSRSESGAGLGLSLARAVARAHGGDIVLESRPGKGSSFRVTLPLYRLA